MGALKKKAWKDLGWERGDEISGGNQGHTFFARRSTDPRGEFNYVLKTLKRQDKPDRRAMFCNEVRAMGVLDHKGVVEVAATNAEEFRDPAVELFLVTHRIDGKDLERLVQAAALSLEDAVRVTVAALGILDHCHRRSVIHRDIKPCHVILRNGSLDDPVLIDFGLAFNRETQPTDAATCIGEGKGNRFLIGPEHLTGNPDTNHNPATDICQCIGLLFYAISQEFPRGLRDGNGKKPHERLANDWLGELPAWKRKALLRMFDVGFEWEASRRWQRIDQLVERLETLLEDSEPSNKKLEHELANIMRQIDDSHTARMETACKMADQIVEAVQSAANSINSAQTERYLSVKWHSSGRQGNKVASLLIVFRNTVDNTQSRAIELVVELSNRRQIDVSIRPHSGHLAMFEDNNPVQLGSYDLGCPECPDVVRDLVADYLAICVAEVLGIDKRF